MPDNTPEDPWESEEWKEYAKSAQEELVPKIKDSAITAMLYHDPPDAKLAIELGYSILLDKPLLIMVGPGDKIPENLRRIADGVIEYGDLSDPKTAARIHAEIDRVMKKRERQRRGK